MKLSFGLTLCAFDDVYRRVGLCLDDTVRAHHVWWREEQPGHPGWDDGQASLHSDSEESHATLSEGDLRTELQACGKQRLATCSRWHGAIFGRRGHVLASYESRHEPNRTYVWDQLSICQLSMQDIWIVILSIWPKCGKLPSKGGEQFGREWWGHWWRAWSREVSKPRDSGSNFSNCSEIWQVPRQRCCRGACQISERYDHCIIQSRGFETSRELAVRRLTA